MSLVLLSDRTITCPHCFAGNTLIGSELPPAMLLDCGDCGEDIGPWSEARDRFVESRPAASKSGPPVDTHDYGRRVEIDRSWTVYHVFSGNPAKSLGAKLVGLSRKRATSAMLALNAKGRAQGRGSGFP